MGGDKTVADLPDYSMARVIKGLYDTSLVTIAVDEDGNIVGVFKGDYNGALKTIAVDSEGRMQANLTAQDLTRVTIRDHDGGIESAGITGSTIGVSGETTLHTKSGAGTLRVAMFKATNEGSHSLTPRVYIDGTKFYPMEQFSAWSLAGFDQTSFPFILSTYNVDGYCVFTYVFDKGIIFDTSLSLRFYNPSPTDTPIGDVSYFYQLVP